MRIRRKLIRSRAEDLIDANGIDQPPVPVDKIAKREGVDLRLGRSEDSSISGFVTQSGNRQIIGVNASHHRNRQRFTIAHELGHLLLHRFPPDEIHVDHRFPVRFRDDLAADGSDGEEREANLFAAELLMPVRFLKDDIGGVSQLDAEDEGEIRELARKYQVSAQAMTFRLINLGFLRL